MNYKGLMRTWLAQFLGLLKPVIGALVLVAFLQVTGLISSVSYISNWALLHSGFKDADSESDANAEQFDYQFMIKDLQGNRFPFEKFKNKVVFLNLWAQWCGPCRAEMAGIQELFEKTDTSKVAFVMLSIDRDSDLRKVTSYLSKGKFSFPTYLPSGYLPEQLHVPLIPTTFVISRTGRIELKQVGSKRYDTPKFQKFLEKLTSNAS